MNFLLPSNAHERDRLQTHLLGIAALFLFFYCLILTLSPGVRAKSLAGPYLWMHWGGFVVWILGFYFLHRQTIKKLEERDPFLLPVVALLCGWGLITIWRLDTYLASRQTMWLIICIGIVFIGLKIPDLLGLINRYKYIWLIFALGLTALTFILGVYPSGIGPELWLGCCGLYLQPSEPLKLLFLVYLASYLAEHIPFHLKLLPVLFPTFLTGIIALGILIAQRDLGTASLFILIYFTLLYLSSGKRRILIVGGFFLLGAGVAGYTYISLIQNRINTWLNPWIDPSGKSYQIIQSFIAIANGGIIGRGPGLGSPGVVPIAHSDFIFTAIAEETGLVGTFAILILFGILLGRGMISAMYAANPYQRFLAAGIASALTIQSIIIIGGNIGALPLTGLTLPFVSYGGSSLVVSFFSVLLLLVISNQTDREPPILATTITFRFISGLFLTSLFILAFFNTIWGIIRSEELLSRPDNVRQAIADRYVKRGSILDRKNNVISLSSGTAGNYERITEYPLLASLVGYSTRTYGQAGIERSMNEYLRGLQGTPSSMVWYNHLLYGQHPPGLDVRLTIDLGIQEEVDHILGENYGAILVMNAQNGEILSASSRPTFDPNRLTEMWPTWISDPDAPLLNRITQAQYPLGAAAGPLLLANTIENTYLPSVPFPLSDVIDGVRWGCADDPVNNSDWGDIIISGCPAALRGMASQFDNYQLDAFFESLGFYDELTFRLPFQKGSNESPIAGDSDGMDFINGLRISPLHVARAISVLSNNGETTVPRIVLSVNTPQQGWITIGANPIESIFTEQAIIDAMTFLKVENQPIWYSTGYSLSRENPVAWYLGGSVPDWQGTPFVTVIALENGSTMDAKLMGSRIAEIMTNPLSDLD